MPSGASTGAFEAVELRDGGAEYGGKGVTRAVDGVVDEIQPELLGHESDDQRLIDQALIDLDRAGAEDAGELTGARLGAELMALVANAQSAGLDPELELRTAARRFADAVRSWERSRDVGSETELQRCYLE